jgi:hypothetical protein
MNCEYNATVHSLCQVGLLALHSGMEEEASSIFMFTRGVLQDPAALDIACALVLSARGEIDRAVDLLQHSTLAEFPDHDMARTALGIVLQAAGRSGWRELYGQVLVSSTDPQAREAATQGLRMQT